MRILLDTNILVRASTGLPSPAADILDRLDNSQHTLVLSQPLLIELSKTLRYDRVRSLHRLDDAAINRYLRGLQSVALVVNPQSVPDIASDPDDNLIIATAIEGQAKVLCTLDKHLRHPNVLAYCDRHGIRILTDVELLRLLRKEEEGPK